MATDDGEARGGGCGTAGHVRGSGCKVHLPTSDAYTEDRLTSHVPGAPPLSPSLRSQPKKAQSRLPNLTLHWVFVSRTWTWSWPVDSGQRTDLAR